MQNTAHKSAKIDRKLLGLAWGAATLAGIALRTVQLFTNIEAKTGFFEVTDWTVYTMYAVFAVFTLVLAILPACSARIPASRPLVRKNRALAFGGFVFATGIAYDVAVCFGSALRTLSDAGGKRAFMLLFSEGLFAEILQSVCGVAACIFMVLVALSYLGEKATYCEYRLLALMPLFWAMFRLVSRFMTKISFTMISELMQELLMLALMMLFMMSFARISAQVNHKGEMKKAICYGLPASFLAVVIGVTRLICLVGGRSELLADGFPFSLADLGFGVFTFIYIMTHMHYGRPASEDDDLPEEVDDKTAALAQQTDDLFLEE